jgi:hypothetical protein
VARLSTTRSPTLLLNSRPLIQQQACS